MRKIKTRSILLAALIAVILIAGISGTVAYLIATDDPVKNTFQPSQVTCEVEETFTDGGTTKSNVRIKNTGDVSAYIRAAVVANWVDKDGNIVEPADISFDVGNGWVEQGEYYFYTSPVASQRETGNLIGSYTARAHNDDLHLQMIIVSQAIQAEGTMADGTKKAVVDAWGVDPESLGGSSATN